jgi:hypothetical protein
MWWGRKTRKAFRNKSYLSQNLNYEQEFVSNRVGGLQSKEREHFEA